MKYKLRKRVLILEILLNKCFGKTEHILKKVNRANQKARTDLLPVFTNRNEYNLLESLILAQDERWRRA